MVPYFSLLRERLDTVVGILGIIIGVCISSLYLISATIHLLTLGVALSTASFMYLIIKGKAGSEGYERDSQTRRLLYEIVFFIAFTLSMLLLYASRIRPPSYFLLIAICVSLVAVSILNTKTKWGSYLQILKILAVSFNLKYSIFIPYDGLGVDYWTHLHMNNLLSQTGSIDVLLGKEPFFPLMHIQVAINQIVTNTTIKDATNLAILIPLVISSICVYLVARRYYGEAVGLFAVLIVNITDFHILWGMQPQTTSFGVCLYYFILFILFRSYSSKGGMEWLLLLLIFAPAIVLVHAVSSFILFVTLAGLLGGSFLYRVFFNHQESVFSLLFLLLYGIVLLQNWFRALYTKDGGNSFFEQIVLTLDYYVTGYADFLNRPEAIAEYTMQLPPFIERVADTFGLTLLIFFSIVGCLLWLSLRYRSDIRISMISCTIIILGITFGFPLFGIRNIIPSRWFVFVYFFLSIMAAFAIVNILGQFERPNSAKVFAVVVFFSFAIFMPTCTIANQDSSLWLTESTISKAYTVQEIKGAETLSGCSNDLFSDSRYGTSILGVSLGLEDVIFQSEDEILASTGRVFLWREYMRTRAIEVVMDIGYYKKISAPKILGDTTLDKLDSHNKIYENDDLFGCYILSSPQI